MSTTRISHHLRAPRAAVYRALLDASAVENWRVPPGMTSRVHTFEPREGGAFRVSLTYEAPDRAGKTSAHTDTYHGRFLQLVPDEKIVESLEFETADPSLQGEMTITTTLVDADGGGTDLHAIHEGLPPGVAPADNATGWRESLARLAALVETSAAAT
ncbi:SRPBCC family protein [Nannocystis punicea]|uniref:SRPBCC family protein n=1 Tax=Nannocystis punicea TaxID=2995304 RepID=A0ABY7HBB7_9BACT|nr:SRPBCC family protein [Nannocystis poenicansa]WAS96349.1 SRPBCC family protein [Nannocystis poenicansa]